MSESLRKLKKIKKLKRKKRRKSKKKQKLTQMLFNEQLKKIEMNQDFNDRHRDQSFETFEFEPNETPIGSLKDPIPLPQK